jgi:MFS family permease
MAQTSGKSAIFALLVVTAVYAFAFVDRQILNMLVEPLRSRFGLSDLEVGYLIGPAFIFSFIVVGLPAGLGVDRFNRRNLVIGAGVIWTLATAAASVASSYGQLVTSRVLIGGAEAVLFPAGISMIADLFERRHLPIANSVFLTAPYVGGGLALIAGGRILELTRSIRSITLGDALSVDGWQIIFLIVAGLGAIPLLLMVLIREPERRGKVGAARTTAMPMTQALQFLASNWPFYLPFYLGMGLACLVNAMIAAWAPTYLLRSFGLTAAAIGTSYGVMVLLAGLAGGVGGPLINHFLSRRFRNSTMWTACCGPALMLCFVVTFWHASTATATMVSLALFTASYSFPLSTAGSSLQVVTPSPMVGVTSAIYLICNSLLGYALGPTIVPLAAALLPSGSGSMRLTLIGLAGAGGLIALVSLIVAARAYNQMLSRQVSGIAV